MKYLISTCSFRFAIFCRKGRIQQAWSRPICKFNSEFFCLHSLNNKAGQIDPLGTVQKVFSEHHPTWPKYSRPIRYENLLKLSSLTSFSHSYNLRNFGITLGCLTGVCEYFNLLRQNNKINLLEICISTRSLN